MKKEYTIESMSNTRTRYTFTEKNSKDETICLDISRIESDGRKGSLPWLWKKNGYTDRILKTYWVVDVYATDKDGNCWGRYNPTIKPGENKLNFQWVLEATEENRENLINEIYRLAASAA